jgi:hypothetical protein
VARERKNDKSYFWSFAAVKCVSNTVVGWRVETTPDVFF